MNYSNPWLEITTYLPCPNRCSYCPQDVLMKAYKGTKKLTFEMFKKALLNVPTDVIIDFAGFSEPFVHPEATDMILYAHLQGYKVMVWTTLVGFTPKDEDKLKSVPFLHFHHHDTGRTVYKPSFVSESSRVEKPNSRGGHLWKVEKRQGITGCTRGMDANVMLPNGDVVLCCSDWGLEHKLGNIFETNFKEMHREQVYDLCSYCTYAK